MSILLSSEVPPSLIKCRSC
uniref:Uncharacterized protein n=1 Tax=Anguilla anguilla TaxID=7936 RepID=A0A0E9PQT3_ANGAN